MVLSFVALSTNGTPSTHVFPTSFDIRSSRRSIKRHLKGTQVKVARAFTFELEFNISFSIIYGRLESFAYKKIIL